MLHGVEVQRGARWSWILWFMDSPTCNAEPGKWHLAEAFNGDPVRDRVRVRVRKRMRVRVRIKFKVAVRVRLRV